MLPEPPSALPPSPMPLILLIHACDPYFPFQCQGVKETFYGYDEDDNDASIDSETSLSSVSVSTISEEDACDEVTSTDFIYKQALVCVCVCVFVSMCLCTCAFTFECVCVCV